MQLLYDIRRPTFVIAGSWNEAIFEPGWMLETLYGIDKGLQINACLMMDQDSQRAAFYYPEQEIGIHVDSATAKIYLNNNNEDVIKRGENFLVNLVQKLQYTPMRAIGFNFNFIIKDPTEKVEDTFMPKEDFASHYKILINESKTTLEIEDAKLGKNFLNIIKKNSKETTLEFNFHHINISASKLPEIIPGRFNTLFEQVKGELKKFYDFNDTLEVMRHEFEKMDKLT